MKTGARRKTTISDHPPPPAPASPPHSVHQRPMNDGENGGNDYDADENEDYEDDAGQSEDAYDHEGGNNGGEERPKLAEGFYEIEALRKKRIRKGVKQYLVKWRGWPESANTWEPVESLTSCPDIIEAFESMSSGKRRRKRKHAVGSISQSKKKQKQKQKQQQDSYDAACPLRSSRIKVIEEPCVHPRVHNSNVTENNVGGTNCSGTANQVDELEEKPKVIKATSSMNQENMTEFAIHIQEDPVEPANGVSKVDEPEVCRASSRTGNANGVSKVDGTKFRRVSPRIGAANGVSKVDSTEVRRASPRIAAANRVPKVDGTKVRRANPRTEAANGVSPVDGTVVHCASPRIGARRRKSCAVKRFKKESNSAPNKDATEKTTAGATIVQDDTRNADDAVNGLESDKILETPQSKDVITKIIKPVNYSVSIVNDIEEVCVSFLVTRSDGEEIVVDNKYLKENNPVLLINFYEQHLRYNSPSE